MRFLPRDPALRWALAAAAGWAALVVVVTAIPEAKASSVPVPVPPVPPPAPVLGGWVLLGSPIVLRRGGRYRGCLKLPWYVPASVGAVHARAEKEGFTDVRVSEGRPPSWPNVECEYFVEATWGREERNLVPPGVVVFAWEGRA